MMERSGSAARYPDVNDRMLVEVPRDSKPVARCHPDRPMHAVGLCEYCYSEVVRHRRRTAEAQLRGDPRFYEGARLSSREVEVIEAIGQGMTNKVVGEALGISEQTVKNHMSSILRKLGAETAANAVWLYFERRFGVSDEAIAAAEYFDQVERLLVALRRDINQLVGQVRKGRALQAAPAPATKLELVDVDGQTIVRNRFRDRGDRCRSNHLFTKDNTRITPKGSRACRTCARDKARALATRQRAALRAAEAA
jgi:DNA-binding CsgD family transcriptional regulator